jgi:hypothetical protein
VCSPLALSELGATSTQADLPQTVRQSRKTNSGGAGRAAGDVDLAHPGELFPIQLNDDWRVVDDPLQWILQRRKGKARSKNSGWRGRSYLTTRSGLLRCVGEYCGEVRPDALAQLAALPERHPAGRPGDRPADYTIPTTEETFNPAR